MTILSTVCVIIGCYYFFLRIPIVFVPEKSKKYLGLIFKSAATTRLFAIAWLIPWSLSVYSSIQSNIGISKLITIWGTVGSILALYIIIFASKYSQQMKERIKNITPTIRVFALLTSFAGVFLIYLGIRVF